MRCTYCLCHWFIDTGINFHTTRFQLSIECGFPKLASGLDSFTLLAIPFFILSGNIMNHGGIARRLINFARIGGRLPGSLAHCNILANMLFGAISGSAVASAAARRRHASATG
ncbi:TRAP transporter large permease subunit [Escherichia coli]